MVLYDKMSTSWRKEFDETLGTPPGTCKQQRHISKLWEYHDDFYLTEFPIYISEISEP